MRPERDRAIRIVTRLEGLCEGLLPRGSGDADLAASGLEGPRGFLPLKADRIKLPEEPPSVDISKWLGPDLWMAFVEPRSLRSLPARPVACARPRPRRLGREEKAVLQKWDKAGRLLLAGAALDPLHRFSTLEALRKDAHTDRQIVDRRGPNGEEDRVAGPSRTIPSPADLVDLECGLEEKFLAAGSDLKHYYHYVLVTPERALTNPIGKPMTPADSAALGFGSNGPPARRRRPAL